MCTHGVCRAMDVIHRCRLLTMFAYVCMMSLTLTMLDICGMDMWKCRFFFLPVCPARAARRPTGAIQLFLSIFMSCSFLVSSSSSSSMFGQFYPFLPAVSGSFWHILFWRFVTIHCFHACAHHLETPCFWREGSTRFDS